MMSAELLGVPAVAGHVDFEFLGTTAQQLGTLELPPALQMFQGISGVQIVALGYRGSGEVALAVALAAIRVVTAAYPPESVLSLGKIDQLGDVALCADVIPGSPVASTNTCVVVSSSAIHESGYARHKSWVDQLPSALAEQRLTFRLSVKFWSVAFAGDPRLQLIGAIAQLLREYLKRVKELK